MKNFIFYSTNYSYFDKIYFLRYLLCIFTFILIMESYIMLLSISIFYKFVKSKLIFQQNNGLKNLEKHKMFGLRQICV